MTKSIAVGSVLSVLFTLVGWEVGWFFGLIWAIINIIALIIGRGAPAPAMALSMQAGVIMLPACFISGLTPLGLALIAPVIVGIYTYFSSPISGVKY